MKFILNESNAKLILDERFVLLEETAEEFKPKEEELKKILADKKTEINNIVTTINELITSAPEADANPVKVAQERIAKYEEPCKKLSDSIDVFLANIDKMTVEIVTRDQAIAVDNFIKIAKKEIYPGDLPETLEDPELEVNLETATTNVEKLLTALLDLFKALDGKEAIDKGTITAAPAELFSSEWSDYIKNASDKKAAWDEYYKAWAKHKGSEKEPNQKVYENIKNLGTAFMQELDKLGYTKANPFLVFLDKMINKVDFNWQSYGTIHNAYLQSPQWVTKDDLLKKSTPGENLIYEPQWYKLGDPNLYNDYLYWQYNLKRGNDSNKPATVDDSQATDKDAAGNNFIIIDGLTITDKEDILSKKANDILYKEGKLRDLSRIIEIAKFFGASESRKKEMTETEAEKILDKFGSMAAHDANAVDLAKLLIYNYYSRVNQEKEMRAHDIPGKILDFSNPDVVADNYEKLKKYGNIPEVLSALLNALVPPKAK